VSSYQLPIAAIGGEFSLSAFDQRIGMVSAGLDEQLHIFRAPAHEVVTPIGSESQIVSGRVDLIQIKDTPAIAKNVRVTNGVAGWRGIYAPPENEIHREIRRKIGA
jgi:hypothetical protein